MDTAEVLENSMKDRSQTFYEETNGSINVVILSIIRLRCPEQQGAMPNQCRKLRVST